MSSNHIPLNISILCSLRTIGYDGPVFRIMDLIISLFLIAFFLTSYVLTWSFMSMWDPVYCGNGMTCWSDPITLIREYTPFLILSRSDVLVSHTPLFACEPCFSKVRKARNFPLTESFPMGTGHYQPVSGVAARKCADHMVH